PAHHAHVCRNFVQRRTARAPACRHCLRIGRDRWNFTRPRGQKSLRPAKTRSCHMTEPGANTPFVAIACGGTGGHLFPGLAVAEQLTARGCAVALLISPKDVDQQAVKSALECRTPLRRDADGHSRSAGSVPGAPLEAFTLPAVALQNRNYFSFAGNLLKSLFAAQKIFRRRKPDAVLAMGGFTS